MQGINTRHAEQPTAAGGVMLPQGDQKATTATRGVFYRNDPYSCQVIDRAHHNYAGVAPAFSAEVPPPLAATQSYGFCPVSPATAVHPPSYGPTAVGPTQVTRPDPRGAVVSGSNHGMSPDQWQKCKRFRIKTLTALGEESATVAELQTVVDNTLQAHIHSDELSALEVCKVGWSTNKRLRIMVLYVLGQHQNAAVVQRVVSLLAGTLSGIQLAPIHPLMVLAFAGEYEQDLIHSIRSNPATCMIEFDLFGGHCRADGYADHRNKKHVPHTLVVYGPHEHAEAMCQHHNKKYRFKHIKQETKVLFPNKPTLF